MLDIKNTIIIAITLLSFSIIGCKKVEKNTTYSVLFNTPSYFLDVNTPIGEIGVTAIPRGKVSYAFYNKSNKSSSQKMEDFIEITEFSNKKVEYFLKKPAFGIGIIVYLFAEGKIQATDTCWYGGIENFNFENKIYFTYSESNVARYYDLSNNTTYDFTPIPYEASSYIPLIGIHPAENRVLFHAGGYNDLYFPKINSTNVNSPQIRLSGAIPTSDGSGVFSENGFYKYSNNQYYKIANTQNSFWANKLNNLSNIDIALIGTDTITVYSKVTNSAWENSNKVYLNTDGTTDIIIDSVYKYASFIDFSISENGKYVYYLYRDNNSYIIKQTSLISPYTTNLIYTSFDIINAIDASPNGASVVILNNYDNIAIIDANTLTIKNLNITVSSTSRPIWK